MLDLISYLLAVFVLFSAVMGFAVDRRREARTVEAFGRVWGVLRLPGESTRALQERVFEAMRRGGMG